MEVGICANCGYEFTAVSRQFYCCNKDKKYCIVCRDKSCKICHKNTINKQVANPRCKCCFMQSKKSNDMLHEPICDQNFCRRCILTRVSSVNANSKITLPCGHQIPKAEVDKFLENSCFKCGNQFDPKVDYNLLNGKKCCFICVKYERAQVQPYIMFCMGCGEVIRNVYGTGVYESDFILCKKCVAESQFGQEQVSLINSYVQPPVIEEHSNSIINQVKPKQESIKKNSEVHEEKKVPEVEKIQQKKEEKKVEQQMSEADKTEEDLINGFIPMKKLILQKFPSERKNHDKSKVKKHLSMDTFVEKMKLQIEKDPKKFLVCPECQYQILESQTFPLIEGIQKVLYCKLCYSFLGKNQHLGFSSSNLLTQSRQRRGTSEGKQSSQYLDRSRQKKNMNEGKKSDFFETDNRTYTTLKPNVVRRESTVHSKQQCQSCKKVGGPTITTTDKIMLCFGCYQEKRRRIK